MQVEDWQTKHQRTDMQARQSIKHSYLMLLLCHLAV